MAADPPGLDAGTNQSPPFEGMNLYLADRPLREAVEREGGPTAGFSLMTLGAACGSAHGFETGRLAEENPPRLRRYGAGGARVDRVEFHPAYHEAMGISIAAGLHASPWEHLRAGGEPPPGAHVARLAGLYIMTQMEPGHVCPVTMTHAAVPALRDRPGPAAGLLQKILTRRYDPSDRPWEQKTGATLGMGLTERQGGTDVRANRTAAEPLGRGGPGEKYRLTGHKWFLSAPMSDAFLMLAQAPGGLTCFLVPRILPDGTRNALLLERLKDKLGNRSNASAEVEIAGATAWALGDEGRGIADIMPMVTMTRLDCAVASAGQMRLALARALHHCRHRTVFGRRLADQPLMTGVLADMALDVEAATALVFRLARAFDRADADPAEAAWRRLMTPVAKYWVCKIAPALGAEAMECLGGNGYVEEGGFPRLYRELPLNAIWEGSGNVMCLDVLRVVEREPETVEAVIAALADAATGDPGLTASVRRLRALLAAPADLEEEARTFTDTLARTAAGTLLRAHAPAAVADSFTASRLAGPFRHTYGVAQIAAPAILERALPPDC